MTAVLGQTLKLGYLENTGERSSRPLSASSVRTIKLDSDEAQVKADLSQARLSVKLPICARDEANVKVEDDSPGTPPLEWTRAPAREVRMDGHARCMVSVPAGSGERQRKLHLNRTTRIEPSASSAKPPPVPGKRIERITVTEADFKRCGSNLDLLRECRVLPPEPVEMQVAPFELSFNSRPERKAHLQNPYKDFLNPELMRDRNESDLVLNQVWLKACEPKKYEGERGALKRNSQLSARRSCSVSTRASSSEEASESLSPGQPVRRERSRGPRSASLTSLRPGSAGLPAVEADGFSTGRNRRAGSRPHSQHHKPPAAPKTPPKHESRIRLIDDIPQEEEADMNKEVSAGSFAVREFVRQQGRYETAIDSQSEEGKEPRVVWLSLDSESGEVRVYPKAVATRIEKAHLSGRFGVPLAGLGDTFEEVIVCLGNTTDGYMPTQKDANGLTSDVRRFEVLTSTSDLRVNVVWDGQWHIVDNKELLEIEIEERSIALCRSECMVPPPSPTLPPVNPDRRTYFLNSAAWDC
mmetsp:Transcript_128605/g.274351  ORF Transcript_128605/g.274351 Transcript_128605/m.274351 type:complete len:526 (+) Transcript_128605:119-1696(+)